MSKSWSSFKRKWGWYNGRTQGLFYFLFQWFPSLIMKSCVKSFRYAWLDIVYKWIVKSQISNQSLLISCDSQHKLLFICHPMCMHHMQLFVYALCTLIFYLFICDSIITKYWIVQNQRYEKIIYFYIWLLGKD